MKPLRGVWLGIALGINIDPTLNTEAGSIFFSVRSIGSFKVAN